MSSLGQAIYDRGFEKGFIMDSTYAKSLGRFEKETAEVEKIISLIQKIRDVRLKNEIAPNKRISLAVSNNNSKENIATIQAAAPVLSKMVNIEKVEVVDFAKTETVNFVTELGEAGFFKSEAVDTQKEALRIAKDIEKMTQEINLLGSRLENPNFVSRAPAALVAKEQERHKFLVESRKTLQEQLDSLK